MVYCVIWISGQVKIGAACALNVTCGSTRTEISAMGIAMENDAVRLSCDTTGFEPSRSECVRFTAVSASVSRQRTALPVLLLPLLLTSLMPGLVQAQATAEYMMTFQGLWTADDITDSSMPGGAHFTQIIGATHNSSTTLWVSGGTASAGVENVAEQGSVSTFVSEINSNGNANTVVRAGSSSISPTAMVSSTFTASSSYPLVSVLSMVAPTPDWFVGVSNVVLNDGSWKDEVVMDLYPYDAGTEEGSGWSLNNANTSPKGTITSIRNSGRFRNNPIARLTFQRQQPPLPLDPEVSFASSSSRAGEGTGTQRVTLNMSPASTSDITVQFSVGGTATRNSDYQIDGSVLVSSGATTAMIPVTIIDDSTVEGNETVVLTLTGSSGYTVEGTNRHTLTITDNDSGTPPPDPPDPPEPPDTSGGGDANQPPTVERPIDDQVVDVGATLDLDIRPNFTDSDQQSLNYTVESADPMIVTVAVDNQGVVTIHGLVRQLTAVTVTATDDHDASVSDTFLVRVSGPAEVPFFPSSSDPVRQGFLRVINHSAEAGEVMVEAFDDRGGQAAPVTLSVGANAVVHFNSDDLEDGNTARGLSGGVGPGEGDWRLVLTSALDFEVLAYLRTSDGFLTSVHDVVPTGDLGLRVAIFNPGSNLYQESLLRVLNAGTEDALVTVSGVDDSGKSPGTAVQLTVPAAGALTVSAADLESGAAGDGALGNGAGKWRLQVESGSPVVAMSLLSSSAGYLTNLSSVSSAPGIPARSLGFYIDPVVGVVAGGTTTGGHTVPYFPSANDALGRQGFVRVLNRSAYSGNVSISVYDDTGAAYEELTLSLGGGETAHFNSDDLELGNAAKGLSGSTGSGRGDWRLVLESRMDLEVMAYVRSQDGMLTPMHDVAPAALDRHWVALFNPGSNENQESLLRLVNAGAEDASVRITGVDDEGETPGSAVSIILLAGSSMTLFAAELETGGEDFEGAFGDGTGNWRLRVESSTPIIVMSLLSSPTGHLANLSTAPDRGPY